MMDRPTVKGMRFPLLALLLIIVLTGCWDRREIEERTSVVAIAIDRTEQHPDMVTLSVQIPIPIKIAGSGASGGGGGGRESVKIMTSVGKTVVDAFQNLQKRLNQELFFGHTRIIAIGENVAREGLDNLLDPFRRDPQIRRLLWPIIVKGEASELLKAAPRLEQIPTVYIMTLIENGAKRGHIPDVNLGDFFIDLSSTAREPYLNYVEVAGDDVKWSGVALFRGNRMVGKLNERETWSLMRIREKKDGGNIVFPFNGDMKKLVTVNTEFVKSKMNATYRDGKPHVEINVELEGNLLEKTFTANIMDSKAIALLEQSAVKYLEEGTDELIRKLQKEYNTDALGIGSYIKARKPDIWKQIDWEDQYPETEIKVNYKLQLRNTGMEMQ